MPFVEPSKVKRRILITGETGSGKTHALRSFPTPKVVMVYPGEQGQDTLLKSDGTPIDAETQVMVWEQGEKALNSTEVIEQVRKATLEMLRRPGLQTFCGDGLHKLYAYVMDALSGGEFFAGSPFQTANRDNTQVVDPRVAGQAEHWISDYLSTLNASRVPFIAITTWDQDKGVRKAKLGTDGKKEKWTDIPTFKMPALYSAASRRVLGEFGYCVHQSAVWKRMEVTPGKYEQRRLYRWQTIADDEVGACAIKGDAEVIGRIPKFLSADWRELAKYVEAKNE